MSDLPPSEGQPVASSSSTPTVKIKFGVDPTLILHEPRKRRRDDDAAPVYALTSKAAAHARLNKYEDPAYVLEKGRLLIQAIVEAREDEYSDGRLLAPDFMTLPSAEDYPDYYQVIKTPLALDDITRNLEAGEYTNVAQVRQAIEHVFWNAKKYNAKGSLIFEDAKYLHKLVKRASDELVGKVDGEVSDEEAAPPKKKKKEQTIWTFLKAKLDRVINKRAADQTGRWLSTEFMEVPSKIDYPDYHRVIRKPRSFDFVLSNLKKKAYRTPYDFVADVDLIFSNAQQYNLEDSQISQDAEEMKILFHELVDDLVQNDAASGNSSKPKIKLKVPKNKERIDFSADPAAANSLASAVAAITGVPVGTAPPTPPPQTQYSSSMQYDIDDDLPPLPSPQQQYQQPPPVTRRPSSSMGTPIASSSYLPPPSATHTPQQQPISLPNRSSSLVTPAVKNRGPPLLSVFTLRPRPGKETITLKNERGVRAHAITLSETAEFLELRVTIRDFVPPPKVSTPALSTSESTPGTNGGASNGAVLNGDATPNGSSVPAPLNGFDVDLSDPLASIPPSSDDPMASPSSTPNPIAISPTDFKAYLFSVFVNNTLVEAMPVPPTNANSKADAEGFSRAPSTRWQFACPRRGAGGPFSLEVMASWTEYEAGTGTVKGRGRESYEVIVNRV